LKLSSDFSGANIYVEQHRILKLLHSGSSSATSLGGSAQRPDARRHCFHSYQGQVALFLEADPNSADPLRKQVASFEYDLQVQPEGDLSDPWEGKYANSIQIDFNFLNDRKSVKIRKIFFLLNLFH
jgi:hypothetical protein